MTPSSLPVTESSQRRRSTAISGLETTNSRVCSQVSVPSVTSRPNTRTSWSGIEASNWTVKPSAGVTCAPLANAPVATVSSRMVAPGASSAVSVTVTDAAGDPPLLSRPRNSCTVSPESGIPSPSPSLGARAPSSRVSRLATTWGPAAAVTWMLER